MIFPAKVPACHHIRLEKGCMWCGRDAQQKINQCDRCGRAIDSDDDISLARTGCRPQLICFVCRIRDQALRGYHEDRSTRK